MSRSDQKTAYRICDACDTEIENFKLKKNHDEIISTQVELIEVLSASLEQADQRKAYLASDYERQKLKLA